MQLTLLSPRKSLNKAYLKVKPSRCEIELFKANLIKLLDGLDESESEEHLKNDLSDFLKNTFYQKFYINTKGRNDLVIHNGPDAKNLAGVLIEAKKPSNKSEMIRPDNLNAKAFHELILYYLRERITNHNLEIRHLAATNIYEWYVFDASLFEKVFAQNKTLVKQFTDFEEGRLSGNTTDFFYRQIAEPFLASLTGEICFTTFDFRDYDKPLRNDDKKDDSKLITLYKLLSPEHLLKLPFSNDSNNLDKAFYAELLHLIGLTESKEGGKKLIGRKKEGERNSGSLIESAIMQLDSLDKISRLENPSQFGETVQDRLFSVALELSITWINRILFLKLLEAQLIRYHKGDQSFAFLNSEKVQNFDDLNSLFFSVLARKPGERNEEVRKAFSNVPYLNSSLFEPTNIEHFCLFISQLKDGKLPVLTSTVLKSNTGKKFAGELATLEYLFRFLEAYDFAGEGSEEIQEENKTLINASVLGLIFEKINGYKDGSFFTPGFITMYMCRETIHRAVIQKFNDLKGWDCQDIEGLYNKIEDRKDANQIINQLKICDPAVGSGHFLVSALNEIIAVKSELKILSDKEGKRLKEYHVEVANDELIITDEDGKLYEYTPASPESQRIQETLFHEKQTIIESCLFGVDINPNSVKICRLRLWIELLKNAYYKAESNFSELETLPNIDINIKCGNSLISRYALDADIKQALKKSKWTIDSYRVAVMSYRNAVTKEEKWTMERLIKSIKSDFETEVAANDKRLVQLRKLNADLFNLTQQTSLFERTKKELAEWNKQVNDQTGKIRKLEAELEEIKSNKIYENAFEWRFEFPEVLNDEGDFVGFDVVIGNPPYLTGSAFKELQQYFLQRYNTAEYQLDLYPLFIELTESILKNGGSVSLITPNSWLKNLRMQKTRKFILSRFSIKNINANISNAFEEAQVDTLIFFFSKNNEQHDITIWSFVNNCYFFKHCIDKNSFQTNAGFVFDVEVNPNKRIILQKVREKSQNLEDNFEITRGVNPYDKYRGQSEDIIATKAYHADHKKDETFIPELRGKHVGMFSYRWDSKHFISYGNWLAAPREPRFFMGPRIIFREIIGERFVSTIIDEDFICDRSLYIAKPRSSNINITFTLGILMSKLLIWLFRLEKNEFDSLFPKIRLEEFKKLPIPKNVLNTNGIDLKAAQILTAKKSEPNADTSSLEKEIDQLVYELYGLTEEEINIVEGK
ncbi:MAG: Eco57I restriction-modification methylase domain-containing protein [Bacteroidales bacterium]|nr:Eco57I restriction-modification methylase domain-containing protein [Bacteroidales bacterium]